MTYEKCNVCSGEKRHDIQPHFFSELRRLNIQESLQTVGFLFVLTVDSRTSPPYGETQYGVACGLCFVCIEPCLAAYSTTPCRALQQSSSGTDGFRILQGNIFFFENNGRSHSRAHVQISDDRFMPCSITVKINSAIRQNYDTTLDRLRIQDRRTRFNGFLSYSLVTNLCVPP